MPENSALMDQSLRGFISGLETAQPGSVLHVRTEVKREFEMQAVVSLLERDRKFPIVDFSSVRDGKMHVVTNVLAHRRVFCQALSVDEEGLVERIARQAGILYDPTTIVGEDRHVTSGAAAVEALRLLPVPKFYPGDGGYYISAALVVAKDPRTGVHTLGYHRVQLHSDGTLGVSLHSRRRMFDYHRAAEERGESLPAAICIGVHPLISIGSQLTPHESSVSKFALIGGLFGRGLEVRRCENIDLMIPAHAEVVIEGEIALRTRKDEGPFGEFTGYPSARSTRNVFRISAMSVIHGAKFQSIAAGMSADHMLPQLLIREVTVLKAVRALVPGVLRVYVPLSGCGFTANIQMKVTRPGEVRQAIISAFGSDHTLKRVVVVDEDVDVTDERDVAWAVATRVQPDRDCFVLPRMLGALLDPSSDSEGLTTKLGIDATAHKNGGSFPDRIVSDKEAINRAREIVQASARQL